MIDKRFFYSSVTLWLFLVSQSVLAVEIKEIGEPVAPSNVSTTSAPAQPARTTTSQSTRPSSTKNLNSALVEMARRQQELQLEVERLRGENEELNHTIEGLLGRMRDMYGDLDRRIQDVEKRAMAAPSQQSAPVTASNAVAGDAVAERKAYERAFNMLRSKRYEQATKAFQRFLQTYPSSEFADNAQYWVGEGYYVTRDFNNASKSFQALINKYPESSKLADAHLKLGFTQYELSQYGDAKKSLNIVLKRHGKTTAARLAKERLDRMKKEGR